MSKTLPEWLSFIESQHSAAIDMGLARCQQVWDRVKTHEHTPAIVTVAGTNGKGTTSACIESMLLASEVSVGKYTSPHVARFNERICLNGDEVNDQAICDAFARIDELRGSIPLTYFEFATLASLLIFFAKKVDVIVLEVGLGGRLDATNIIDADVAVITSIGLDHQSYLGDTLSQISKEKAGIIKSDSDIVLGFNPQSVDMNMDAYHKYNKSIAPLWSKITRETDSIELLMSMSQHDYLASNLKLDHIKLNIVNTQLPVQNAVTAILAIMHLAIKSQRLNTALLSLLNDEDLLTQVLNQIKLPGRYQYLSETPRVIADVAHNQAACEYLALKLRDEEFSRVLFVIGMLKDKNIEASIDALLPVSNRWLCCDLPGERGEKAQRMVQYLNQQAEIDSFQSIEDGLQSAFEEAQNTDIICVFGSFVTVAKATEFCNLHKKKA